MTALFPLGQVVATSGALEVLAETGTDIQALLARHQSGDWGEVPSEDARENRISVEHGFRLVSSYPIGEASAKVWIITEADRSSTCLLLPSEYCAAECLCRLVARRRRGIPRRPCSAPEEPKTCIVIHYDG